MELISLLCVHLPPVLGNICIEYTRDTQEVVLRQTNLNLGCTGMLCRWIGEVIAIQKASSEEHKAAILNWVWIHRQLLTCMQVDRQNYQMFGLVCLALSAPQLLEKMAFRRNDVVENLAAFISSRAFTPHEFKDMLNLAEQFARRMKPFSPPEEWREIARLVSSQKAGVGEFLRKHNLLSNWDLRKPFLVHLLQQSRPANQINHIPLAWHGMLFPLQQAGFKLEHLVGVGRKTARQLRKGPLCRPKGTRNKSWKMFRELQR